MSISNQIKISAVVFVILGACFIMFLIYPLFEGITKNSEEVLTQKAALLVFEAKTENVKEFKSYSREIAPNLEKIESIFVDPEVPVEFIKFLEKIARDCQVSLKVSSISSQPDRKAIWPALTLQATSFSPLPDLLRFLDKVNSSIYLIEIQNINISRLTEAEVKTPKLENFSVGDARASFSLKVFAK